MGDPYLDALLQDAKAFQALSPATHAEVQTYILAVIADTLYDTGTDPDHLAYLSRCFGCLNPSTLLEAKVYLMADLAQFELTPNTLLYYARCYPCIPEGSSPEVISYLYSGDPNGPGINDPSLLAQAAKDFQKLSPVTLLQIQVYLLALIDEVTPDPNTIADLARCFRCFPYPYLIATFIQALDYLEPLPDPEEAPNRNPPPGSPHDPPPRPDHPPTRDGGGRGGGGIPVCTDTAAQLTPVLIPVYDGTMNLTTVTVFIPRNCCKGGAAIIWGSDDPDFASETAVISISIPARQANYTTASVDLSAGAFDYYRAKVLCDDAMTGDYSNIIGDHWMPLDTMESYTVADAVNGLNKGVNWGGAYTARESYAQVLGTDTMESYTVGSAVAGLNGGTGWPSGYET